MSLSQGIAGAESTSHRAHLAVPRILVRLWPDWLLMAVLGTCSFVLASSYLHVAMQSGLRPNFYQVHFGPAVMMACGRGYVSPQVDASPSLAAFLRLQRDTISCADLPLDLPVVNPTSFQRASKYLFWTCAAVWRVAGI